MSAATATAKAMPDFTHRLACDYEPDCADALAHDVEAMLMRSKGMLNVLSDLHQETHLNQMNGDNISWALMSVIRELDDVFALVLTYRDAIAKQKA